MPNEYEDFLTSRQRAAFYRVHACRIGAKRVYWSFRTGQWWWRPYREVYYGPYWESNGHGLLHELTSVRLVKWYWLSFGMAMYETQGG